MGMAASQVRFLSLQNRKNTIGLNLMTLSNRKTALSRDMSRVANEYNNAMNQKTLKWSNDSGVTYSDLTYDKLMKPNELNTTKPYIITDAQGRVVLDDSIIPLEDGANSEVTYRDLAMMISSYSGHDTSTGKATYNNLGNLNGGTGLKSDAIRDISDKNSIADKAVSGSANTDNEYQIVTSSQNMVTNSLRYEIMSKLGLISPAEKTEIINNEMKLYGSANNDKGPYPVGTLMGDYYLAKANYEAYRNLLMNGEYTFAADSATNVNTLNKTYEANDGTGEINYTNTVNGTGTSISFNGQSAELSKVDLKKYYNSTTDSVEDLTTTKTDNLSSYLSYAISNGQITYNYGTSTMLNMIGNCDVDLKKNGDSKVDLKKDNVYKKDLKGASWAEMYQNNYTIELFTSNGENSGLQATTHDNLTQIVNELGDDFKSQDAISIDEAAVNKAKESTIAFFEGKITNNNSIIDKHHMRWSGAGDVNDSVYKNVNNNNLITASNKATWRVSYGFGSFVASQGRTIQAVSFQNLYNTFVTFYDYYKHQPNAVAITNGNPVTIPSTKEYKPVDTSDVTYSNSATDKDTFDDNGTKYIRIKGSMTAEDGSKFEFYDYYLTDASGNKTGNLVQRDVLDSETNQWERSFFDPVNNGANARKYKINDTDYMNYAKKINKGTDGGEALDTASSTVGAADNQLVLSYKDENGNDVTYILHNEVKKSSYATTITANPVDILSDLQKKVDEAAVAKDAALKELDTLFAEKDAKIMDYFDALFNMISQNGWVYDENVNNQDKQEESKNYLNAKLQNNMYFITEVETLDGKDFNYATKLATNVSKVFQVYDTDAQNTALSKYESEKADINAKEKQIDIRMNKLETEQDAIKTELDSIKSIIKDNVDSTFKIFT